MGAHIAGAVGRTLTMRTEKLIPRITGKNRLDTSRFILGRFFDTFRRIKVFDFFSDISIFVPILPQVSTQVCNFQLLKLLNFSSD